MGKCFKSLLDLGMLWKTPAMANIALFMAGVRRWQDPLNCGFFIAPLGQSSSWPWPLSRACLCLDQGYSLAYSLTIAASFMAFNHCS